MKAIIDGKFNPKCVEVHGNQIAIYLADNHRFWITFSSREDVEPEADGVRRFARIVAEQALGHKLEDYVDLEPWRYGVCCHVVYRMQGTEVRKWERYRGWCESCDFKTSLQLMHHSHFRDVTAEEAANRIGRAALGLPVEAEETGMWWDEKDPSKSNALLYRKKGSGLQFWDAETVKWASTFRSECNAIVTPATRSSIIEKYGEAPLK